MELRDRGISSFDVGIVIGRRGCVSRMKIITMINWREKSVSIFRPLFFPMEIK